MMKVPFSDLSAQHRELKKELLSACRNVIEAGDFILGEDVGAFEREFARLTGADYAVGISSGTDALFIALKAMGIGPGDEVIVPAFTYIATALAVSYTGARVVFADIDENSYNLDPASFRSRISRRTKAVIPVHLYGQPADMVAINRIARARGLKVIEDAAQAHGARVAVGKRKWRIAGSVSDAGCFSFYPSKNLGGLGDGGMITTSRRSLCAHIRRLRDYGRVSKYEHALIGYNTRLDTLQAAFLRAKLKRLARWNRRRQQAAAWYDALFSGVDGIRVPQRAPGRDHVYHVYAVRVPKRDKVFTRLLDKGVGAIIHYPIPVHLQQAYRPLAYKKGDFPVSERVSREIISLPIYPHISKQQVTYVARTLKKIVGAL